MQTNFKRVQLLPFLTPEWVVGQGRSAMPSGVRPRVEAQPAPPRTAEAQTTTRLPQPSSKDGAAERITFGLLALSGAVGIGQLFGSAIQLSANWPMFDAYVTRLLG